MVSNRPGQHYEEHGMLESNGSPQSALDWKMSLSISSIDGEGRHKMGDWLGMYF